MSQRSSWVALLRLALASSRRLPAGPDLDLPENRLAPARARLPVRTLLQPLHGPILTQIRPRRGLSRGMARLLRCHPWNPGGYDPP